VERAGGELRRARQIGDARPLRTERPRQLVREGAHLDLVADQPSRFTGPRPPGSSARKRSKSRGPACWLPEIPLRGLPSKFPTQTPMVVRAEKPTAQASRWPYEVPVFQATAGTSRVSSHASGRSGRCTSVRISATARAASGEKRRTGSAREFFPVPISLPWAGE